MKRNFIKLFLTLLIFWACDREYEYTVEEDKAVQTVEVLNIEKNSALLKGMVNSTKGGTFLERGFMYSETRNLGANSLKVKDQLPEGVGAYEVEVTGLRAGIPYYVKAYATTTEGTAYGSELTFTTKSPTLAVITTGTPNTITQTSAKLGGTVTDSGGAPVTLRGIVYSSTSGSPSVNDSKVLSGNGTGSFSVDLLQLSVGTVYYARAFAETAAGVAYGNVVSFTTQPAKLATISTIGATNITFTTAVMGGNITESGGAPVTERGVVYSSSVSLPSTANSKITAGSGTGTFSAGLQNLTAGTVYYARAYAISSAGTSYGNTVTFTTQQPVLATVSTTAVTNITQYTANTGGNITADGGSIVTERGVVYSSTRSTPTVNDSQIYGGSGMGSFYVSMLQLSAGTTYFVRAYAKTAAGVSYGNTVTFTTSPVKLATLTTNTATSISNTSSVTGGSISDSGGAAVTERGVAYSSSKSLPTTADAKVLSGSGTGSFNVTLQNLNAATTYYARAYAVTSAGTAYGNAISFTTLNPNPPAVSTYAVSSITQTTASAGGEVTSGGGGSITERGVVFSTNTTTPTVNDTKINGGTGTGSFSVSLSQLISGRTYYLRAYAVNASGVSYGNMVSFTTLSPSLPTGLTTNSPTGITATDASLSGGVSGDGGAPITSRGFVISSTTSTPVIGSAASVTSGTGIGSFSVNITGLNPNTTYYVRSFATNSAGTAYGAARSFTTPQLTVGQSYGGGKVAYIFKSGDNGYVSGETHGLIIPATLPSTTHQWGCYGTSISTSTSLGTGASNTVNITSSCTTTNIAARIASDFVSGGQSDWFLPSYSDFLKVAENRTALSLPNSTFWTSSHYSSYSAYAMNPYSSMTYYSKSGSYRVLPVRKF